MRYTGGMQVVIVAMTVLAQRATNDVRLGEIVMWLGVLGGAVIVLGVVLMGLRKRLRDTPPQARDLPFTLSDLRRMHREGRLTDAEFDRAKHQVIALSTGAGAQTGVESVGDKTEDGNLGTEAEDSADQDDKDDGRGDRRGADR